jgi:hypothetical protein
MPGSSPTGNAGAGGDLDVEVDAALAVQVARPPFPPRQYGIGRALHEIGDAVRRSDG